MIDPSHYPEIPSNDCTARIKAVLSLPSGPGMEEKAKELIKELKGGWYKKGSEEGV